MGEARYKKRRKVRAQIIEHGGTPPDNMDDKKDIPARHHELQECLIKTLLPKPSTHSPLGSLTPFKESKRNTKIEELIGKKDKIIQEIIEIQPNRNVLPSGNRVRVLKRKNLVQQTPSELKNILDQWKLHKEGIIDKIYEYD